MMVTTLTDVKRNSYQLCWHRSDHDVPTLRASSTVAKSKEHLVWQGLAHLLRRAQDLRGAGECVRRKLQFELPIRPTRPHCWI
jgi:hypothetical protein